MAKGSERAQAAEASVGVATAPTVAVVGGGLAGLTAALHLAKAGFAVTIFEARSTLGGNVSSQAVDGTLHDVYPHMFCQWYDNFWELFETELGIPREKAFAARNGVKVLRKGETEYLELLNATTLPAALANLKSGVLSPPEMFLLGFSMLDLVAHPFDRSGLDQLDMITVNGFIYSRGYATEPVARLQNYVLMLIWSINSSMTAAASYQDFIKHTFSYPDGAPFAWMLKGSLAEMILAPLEKRLVELGCTIVPNAPVTSVRIVDGLPEVRTAVEGREVSRFDHLVLAVRPDGLAKLAMGEVDDVPGTRITEKLPDLSQLQTMWNTPIPVVDLYLKKKLGNFPIEHIGLAGSRFDLTVLDFSQLWTDQTFAGTALVIAASDPYGLPSSDPDARGHMIIKELAECIPQFKPGKYWGDTDSDIDWTRTHYRSNDEYPLFINDIGSWQWRPQAAYPDALPRVYFAGDFCRTDVDMATMEAAVQSGILAARAVQLQDAQLHRNVVRGDAIEMAGHKVYSLTTFRAAKLLLLPLAYGAVVWAAREQRQRMTAEGALALGSGQWSLTEYIAVLPLSFGLDWLKSAYWLARSLSHDPATAGTRPDVLYGESFTGDLPTNPGAPPQIDDDDRTIGIGEATLLSASHLFDTMAKAMPGRGAAPLAGTLGTLLAGMTRFAADTATAFADSWAAGQAGSAPATGPKRRVRIKP